MALGIRSLVDSARKLVLSQPANPDNTTAISATELFPPTNPEIDGEDCSHDCESCHISYPRGFKIEESDLLYGNIKGWSTHVLVATSKTDWVRDVEHEKGSVMQAFGKADKPANGRMMLSASNMPTPSHSPDYAQPTTILLLPAFAVLENVTPASVPTVVEKYINHAPTNTSPLAPLTLPKSIAPPLPDAREITARPCPHSALILLCSQKTRDARCGQSAPLLRKELERHLRPLGLFRDLDDERPGGVGIYFISHVGGHKYSANAMVYRRPDAFGVDAVERAKLGPGDEVRPVKKAPPKKKEEIVPEKFVGEGTTDSTAANGDETIAGSGDTKMFDAEDGEEGDVGAGQCLWLARLKPEDCENLVKYTVLQGKVVKPETQLRGGFDRGKGLLSW